MVHLQRRGQQRQERWGHLERCGKRAERGEACRGEKKEADRDCSASPGEANHLKPEGEAVELAGRPPVKPNLAPRADQSHRRGSSARAVMAIMSPQQRTIGRKSPVGGGTGLELGPPEGRFNLRVEQRVKAQF